MKMNNLLLTICLVIIVFSTQAQNTESVPVSAEKISDNLYLLTGGRGANAGFYIGDNEVLVIDSKMDKNSVEEMQNVIKKITTKPITMLINTHSDGDHINGNPFFSENVTILSHENCRKEFLIPQRDGSLSPWQTNEMIRFVPEITFSDSLKVHLGNKTIELYYFGVGHTTGDLVVYFPEEKTAFIGDQVFFERPQLIHSYKGGNSFEHVKTTEKMLSSLDIQKFCSGHSGIKSKTDVENHLSEIKAMQKKVKDLMAAGKQMSEIQTEFKENESRLVESIFNEIKAMY